MERILEEVEYHRAKELMSIRKGNERGLRVSGYWSLWELTLY